MDFAALEEVNLLFGPTGTFQELSIVNGWPNYYIKISEKFDSIYSFLKTVEKWEAIKSEIAKKGFLSRLMNRL